jgi:hypothetical protein
MKIRLYLSLIVVALLCLVGWTGYAEGQRNRPERQAWEYKSLVAFVEGDKMTLHEDGRRLPGSSTPISSMPELGAQGWELVSVAATATQFRVNADAKDHDFRPHQTVVAGNAIASTTFVYWFKRPK